jgi:hypothetical protein
LPQIGERAMQKVIVYRLYGDRARFETEVQTVDAVLDDARAKTRSGFPFRVFVNGVIILPTQKVTGLRFNAEDEVVLVEDVGGSPTGWL